MEENELKPRLFVEVGTDEGLFLLFLKNADIDVKGYHNPKDGLNIYSFENQNISFDFSDKDGTFKRIASYVEDFDDALLNYALSKLNVSRENLKLEVMEKYG